MNNYIPQFKDDIFSGVVDLIKNIWKPIFMGYIIFYIITRLLGFGMMALFGFDKVLEMTNSIQEWMLDPEKAEEYGAFILEKIQQPEIIVALILAIAFGLLVMGWSYNFVYRVIEEEVKGSEVDVQRELSWSFNNKIYGIIGISFLYIIISWIVFGVGVGISAAISPFLLIISIPLIIFFIIKLILALPAYVLGDLSIPEAFKFSYDHLTAYRVLKVIAIAIAFVAALILISIVLQTISTFIVSGNSTLTYIMSTIMGFFTNALMVTVIGACFSALYYRYAEIADNQRELNIEDHLIDN